jgi:hypothetical protein
MLVLILNVIAISLVPLGYALVRWLNLSNSQFD